MTIFLGKSNAQQKNVSDTYSISISAVDSNITLEQLWVEFEIQSTALIIIDLMKFHLRTGERMREFASRMQVECSPLSLLRKMRKEDIDAHGYTDKATFVHDYYKDKRSAFERLFQEQVNDWKMDEFSTDDPERIYDVYLQQGKYTPMTRVAMSV